MKDMILLTNELALAKEEVFDPKNNTLKMGRSQIKLEIVKSYSTGVHLIKLDN